MTSIAVLGTGLLGSGFVEAACGRGWEVTVWNRTPAKAEALASVGARVAATPAQAVRGVQRVHLVLRDDASVEDVLGEALPAVDAGTVICDHTTTQPALTAARAQRLADQGVAYLHCPVFMGPPAARDAKGSMLVAGPRALFEGVQDELTQMTGRLAYLGERPDQAAVIKLMGNALIIGVVGLLADALALGRSAGLSPEEALGVMEFINPGAVAKLRGPRMAAGSFDPSFALTMARKDVRLMLETAEGLPLAVLPGLAARMDALIQGGHGDQDVGVLAVDAVR
jgi:3-hydroxyisobutyrate dehydrogenase-like beta-hydroxyacid dehydrogenase